MKLTGEIFQVTEWSILFRPRGRKEAWLPRSALSRLEVDGDLRNLPAPAVICLPWGLALRKFGSGQ